MKKYIYKPLEIFIDEILLETTIIWLPILSNNEIIIGTPIFGFGPRYFPLKIYNSEHPNIIQSINKCHQEQKVILIRKQIHPESLQKRMTI